MTDYETSEYMRTGCQHMRDSANKQCYARSVRVIDTVIVAVCLVLLAIWLL